jgi:CheY-like chemotaxis protein
LVPDISLSGMRVLVMEDEFLIAMDVEQICRDHGAADVVIVRTLDDLGPDPLAGGPFNVAILDVMLSGASTTDFARKLSESHVPYIFATGYPGADASLSAFSHIEVVNKPYASEVLVEALARAMTHRPQAAFDPIT